MAPKRGERVAPPARTGEWTLIFGEKAAAEGWEELCRQAPGNTREAWESISRNPRDRTKNPDRVAQLRGELGTRVIKGMTLEQWQYEVTSGGRIWYCPHDAEQVVYLTHAACGHARQTGR